MCGGGFYFFLFLHHNAGLHTTGQLINVRAFVSFLINAMHIEKAMEKFG
jgi:hypothetical protein